MTSKLRQLLQIFSVSLLKSVINTIKIHDYIQRNVSPSSSPELKKKKKTFTRIGVSVYNSVQLCIKTLNKSNFRKKIKSSFLNVLDRDDSYTNVTHLLQYFTKLT